MISAAGNYFFQKVFREYLGWKAKSIILFNLVSYCVLVCYGFVGFYSSDIGLRKGWEIFMFGVFYGFNMGSIQSFSRALMSSLIPSGLEAQLFGFYEITDKGSSFIGPAIVTLITQYTNNIRFLNVNPSHMLTLIADENSHYAHFKCHADIPYFGFFPPSSSPPL